ncbi:Chagasin family peptidase inhibitor I42 [uncultured archaeon]|nr:Chagasin family peptidase inhibitor I42 [uncultured archaeon]
MKTKKSLIIIGLVAIATITAGTVIGVSLMSKKPIEKQTPSAIYCNVEDNNSTISIKKGDQVNLTLQDYGDGGYTWTIVTLDEQLLKKESEKLNWGSTGMLGDFGKDTWIFTALNTGNTTLKLECARSFNTTDIAQTFVVTINIQ